MAVLPNVNPTYIDLVKMMAPDGSIDTIAEVLNGTYEGMDEMVFAEGNLPTGHRHTMRTGLPTATWGRLYKGVLPSKGDTAQVTDNAGFLESLSEVDKRLVDMAPDPMKFRFNQDRPHLEVMTREMFDTIFHGGFDDVEKFVGLEARFSDPDAANGANIIDGGSVAAGSDKTSIYVVGWSEKSVFGFVPRGSKAGLEAEDSGVDWVMDENQGRYKILRSYWRWSMGLAMPDWRYIIRIPNIKLSELTNDGATGPVIHELLFEAFDRLPSDAFSTTRLAIYANRKIVTKMRTQLLAQTKQSTLAWRDLAAEGGSPLSPRRKLFFDGVPLNRTDVLDFSEPLVSFS